MKEIGTGILHWEGDQCSHGRMSVLFSLSGDRGPVQLNFDRSGVHVQLIAEVREVLSSFDPDKHSSKVVRPKVGQKIILCEGLLYSCDDVICYEPNKKRGTTLLDLDALYLVLGHSVTLYFKENTQH